MSLEVMVQMRRSNALQPSPAVPMATLVCHCRNCQKQSGRALSVIASFCGTCGSPVITDIERAREQGVIFIEAGTFDEFSDLRPTMHYRCKRAHPWLPLPARE